MLFLRVTDVVHTVGPMARSHVGPTETNDLTSCYQNSLRLMKEHGLRTVVSSSHEHYLAAQTAKFCVNGGASEKCSENLETVQERDVLFFFPLSGASSEKSFNLLYLDKSNAEHSEMLMCL